MGPSFFHPPSSSSFEPVYCLHSTSSKRCWGEGIGADAMVFPPFPGQKVGINRERDVGLEESAHSWLAVCLGLDASLFGGQSFPRNPLGVFCQRGRGPEGLFQIPFVYVIFAVSPRDSRLRRANCIIYSGDILPRVCNAICFWKPFCEKWFSFWLGAPVFIISLIGNMLPCKPFLLPYGDLSSFSQHSTRCVTVHWVVPSYRNVYFLN